MDCRSSRQSGATDQSGGGCSRTEGDAPRCVNGSSAIGANSAISARYAWAMAPIAAGLTANQTRPQRIQRTDRRVPPKEEGSTSCESVQPWQVIIIGVSVV